MTGVFEWRSLRPLEESDEIEFHLEALQDSEDHPAIVPQHLRLRPLDQLIEHEEGEGGSKEKRKNNQLKKRDK